MPRYDVYIPFIASYEGEPYEEEFSTIVKAENEKDAIQKAINELNSEYVVKTIDSREITVEQIPEFPSFDEWEESFTAINNPHAQEGEEGLGRIMFDTDGDQYQTVRGFDSSKIWTIRSTEYGLMLTAGLGFVDRFGYILSEESFTEEDKAKAFIID
jgi:ribosomal protein L20A (L18A)